MISLRARAPPGDSRRPRRRAAGGRSPSGDNAWNRRHRSPGGPQAAERLAGRRGGAGQREEETPAAPGSRSENVPVPLLLLPLLLLLLLLLLALCRAEPPCGAWGAAGCASPRCSPWAPGPAWSTRVGQGRGGRGGRGGGAGAEPGRGRCTDFQCTSGSTELCFPHESCSPPFSLPEL